MRYPFFVQRNQLQQWIAGGHLAVLRKLAGNRAMPIKYWLMVRNLMRILSYRGSGLTVSSLEEPADQVGIPQLEESLGGCSVGAWRLDAPTIRMLWSSLELLGPTTILEFGSGTSTVVLASYAASRRNRLARIVSVEQNEWALADTRARLAEKHLDSYAEVFHAPVTPAGAYRLDPGVLQASFHECRPNWILIDGPVGPPGCRVHTLLEYGRLCAPGARWFLDDAFRNGELNALSRWSRTPGIEVEGIYPVGKGLATGIISRPELIPDPCG